MLQRMPMFLTSMKIRMFQFTLIQSIIPILKQLEFCYLLRMTRFVQSIQENLMTFLNWPMLMTSNQIIVVIGSIMATVAVWKQGTVVMLPN